MVDNGFTEEGFDLGKGVDVAACTTAAQDVVLSRATGQEQER